MFNLGVERFSLIRNKQLVRVALLSIATVVIAALVGSPIVQLWTWHLQSQAAYGDRRPSRTRITLCTQVLNEVCVIALMHPQGLRAHQLLGPLLATQTKSAC